MLLFTFFSSLFVSFFSSSLLAWLMLLIDVLFVSYSWFSVFVMYWGLVTIMSLSFCLGFPEIFDDVRVDDDKCPTFFLLCISFSYCLFLSIFPMNHSFPLALLTFSWSCFFLFIWHDWSICFMLFSCMILYVFLFFYFYYNNLIGVVRLGWAAGFSWDRFSCILSLKFVMQLWAAFYTWWVWLSPFFAYTAGLPLFHSFRILVHFFVVMCQ